jgi:hypothetical protein
VTDRTLFRVWPDGTTQEADALPYSWMSDDYELVWAMSEDEALTLARNLTPTTGGAAAPAAA